MSANGRPKKATEKLRAGQTVVGDAVRRLRERGVTEAQIDELTIDNPRRFLAPS